MFSAKHWQLEQNSCLSNDNARRNIAAVLTTAEVGVLQDLGWGGLDPCGSFIPPAPRWPQGRRCGPGQPGSALPFAAALGPLRGRRGSVLPRSGGLDVERGSVPVPFLAEGARQCLQPRRRCWQESLPLAEGERSRWDTRCHRPWRRWQLGWTGSPAAGIAGADPARAVLRHW